MKALIFAFSSLLVSCLNDPPRHSPIENAGQAVAQCSNILNENQSVYKNGNLLTFVIRGRDPACQYILKSDIKTDTLDAAYYRGISCQEHYSNAYILFRYRVYTDDRLKISISEGVQDVAIGLGGNPYETLEKISIAYGTELSLNDSFPEYSCSP